MDPQEKQKYESSMRKIDEGLARDARGFYELMKRKADAITERTHNATIAFKNKYTNQEFWTVMEYINRHAFLDNLMYCVIDVKQRGCDEELPINLRSYNWETTYCILK
jgi:hypothetical protein